MGQKISCRIEENEAYVRKRLENCDDFIIRPMLLGEEKKICDRQAGQPYVGDAF